MGRPELLIAPRKAKGQSRTSCSWLKEGRRREKLGGAERRRGDGAPTGRREDCKERQCDAQQHAAERQV